MFLENLEKYLMDNGIKAAQFEKICGLGNASVQSWRKGKSPTLASLEKIADATGIPAWRWVK